MRPPVPAGDTRSRWGNAANTGYPHVFRESTGEELFDSVRTLGPAQPGLGGVLRVIALVEVEEGTVHRSQYSGEQNCIMRYPEADAYFPIARPGSDER